MHRGPKPHHPMTDHYTGRKNSAESNGGAHKSAVSGANCRRCSEEDRKLGTGTGKCLYDGKADQEITRGDPSLRKYVLPEEGNNDGPVSKYDSAGDVEICEKPVQ
ncbi:hypothetical protein DL771_001660 [Monosporascus sp. 5C6A]|nr:hypothetical protein DL771_001660 [Monosporascus sp. 5C6A]